MDALLEMEIEWIIDNHNFIIVKFLRKNVVVLWSQNDWLSLEAFRSVWESRAVNRLGSVDGHVDGRCHKQHIIQINKFNLII